MNAFQRSTGDSNEQPLQIEKFKMFDEGNLWRFSMQPAKNKYVFLSQMKQPNVIFATGSMINELYLSVYHQTVFVEK